MNKALVGLFISLGFLVPALASASHSHNKPSKDRTPPSVTSIHMASSNANPAKAVAGDTVTITFTTSEKIKTPAVLAETKALFVKARNTGGNVWEASYVVKANDRTGKVDYLLAMTDTVNNAYVCSSARIFFIKYCPTTDGSSVTIYKETTPPVDTEAPVIAVHEDVYATTTETTIAVEYALPEATDNVDASVEVSCAPASGSEFAVGTTTVTCTAQDAAGNEATSTFAVIVSEDIVVPPADTEAPVIAAHADVYATTTETSAVVEYTTPLATDNVDTSVAVSCTPASGSTFSLGTTTVTCTAQDAAGNEATSTFSVVVTQEIIVVPPPEPSPYTMASQPDESYLCGVENASWRYCDLAGTFSFTDAVGEGIKTIDLGTGSIMGTGTLETVTIAGNMDVFHPWDVTISCFEDSAHTTPCGGWTSITDDANDTTDGTYWVADFSSLNRTFNQTAYYTLTINDTGWEAPAYGSESQEEPYWVITGLR